MKNQKFFTWLIMGLFFLFGAKGAHSQTELSWQQTSGPEGGQVWSLAINSQGHVFAGTYHSGIYRSTDNGQTWEQLEMGQYKDNSVFSLVINSSDVIFAGVNGGGILCSTDNGDTWQEKNNGFTHGDARALVIDPTNGYIFAGTYDGGIYRSTNNGESWEHVFQRPDPSTPVYVFAIAISPITGDAYAACGFWGVLGVYRSTDDGASWDIAGLAGENVRSVAVHPITGDIFAATFCGLEPGKIFRSDYSGNDWTDLGSLSCSVFAWAFDSSGNIYAGVYQNWGVHRSTDNGDSWTHIGINKTVCSLVFNSVGDIFAGTQDHGIYQSTLSNFTDWTQINNGLKATDILAIATNSNGDIFAGDFGYDIFRSTDKGQSWTPLDSHLGVFDIAINSQGHIFSSSQPIGRSIDNGDHWDFLDISAWCIAINTSDHIFAGTWDGIFRSTDNGDTWGPKHLADHFIYAIAVNPSGHIFAGTRSDGIYRSMDGGTSWDQVWSPGDWVMSIAINNDGDIFAGIESSIWDKCGIWRSTDNGENWEKVFYYGSRCLAINSEGHIFAGSYGGGILRSTDNGDSWTEINEGLTNFNIRDLAFDPDGYLYAGTWSSGVFRSVESTLEYTLERLIEEVQNSDIHQGIRNSLVKKLENASKSIEKGNINAAINQIKAFQNEVRAQSGKKIPVELAERWIYISERIIQDLLED